MKHNRHPYHSTNYVYYYTIPGVHVAHKYQNTHLLSILPLCTSPLNPAHKYHKLPLAVGPNLMPPGMNQVKTRHNAKYLAVQFMDNTIECNMNGHLGRVYLDMAVLKQNLSLSSNTCTVVHKFFNATLPLFLDAIC